MNRFIVAAALAALLPASFAMAQDMEPKMMMTNMTMVETTIGNAFKKYDIATDPATLTGAQMAEIISVLDQSLSGGMQANTVKGALEAAINRK